MIVYPSDWEFIGQPVTTERLEHLLLTILGEIDCNDLSFSGGLDSSVMLYYLSRNRAKVRAWTIGLSEDHPDVVYSRRIAKLFGNVEHTVFIPTRDDIELATMDNDLPGDEAVRLFYGLYGSHGSSIIACDGVDELMCGYYDHQRCPSYDTFFHHLRALRPEHLLPLHENSGNIRVYLPYLDFRFASSLLSTPIDNKVDSSNRKKLMVELASGKLPDDAINRWKYGFCDALRIKRVVRYDK